MPLSSFKKSVVFATAVVATCTSSVSAMDIQYGSINATNYAAIVLSGDILPEDGAKFAVSLNLLDSKNLVPAVVRLNSLGGNVASAMVIGEMIRARRMITYVPPDGQCLSACFSIWLAGVMRGAGGTLGVHGSYDPANIYAPLDNDTSGMEEAYWSRMGAPSWLLPYARQFGPSAMYRLEPHQVEELKYSKAGWAIVSVACSPTLVTDECALQALFAVISDDTHIFPTAATGDKKPRKSLNAKRKKKSFHDQREMQ